MTAGKLLIGADEYSFAQVAAPYAQELLDMQTARTFALTELGKQVGPMGLTLIVFSRSSGEQRARGDTLDARGRLDGRISGSPSDVFCIPCN